MQAYYLKCPAKKEMKGYQGHNHEERQAGDLGHMPRMWDQDIQDGEELD